MLNKANVMTLIHHFSSIYRHSWHRTNLICINGPWMCVKQNLSCNSLGFLSYTCSRAKYMYNDMLWWCERAWRKYQTCIWSQFKWLICARCLVWWKKKHQAWRWPTYHLRHISVVIYIQMKWHTIMAYGYVLWHG